MTAISTRVISRSTCGPRPPLVQLDNQYPSLSARSPDSIRRSEPPARSALSEPPPLSAMAARSPSPPTILSSGACATSPPRAPDAPRSANASPSNIASPTTPRSRGASLAISACARTSSTPGVTPPSSTSRCSTLARPRDYAGFKPFGALVDNVTDLDVVTGDGRLVTCSPEHESELFDMVLAGQGQCGVIVRAGLPLMPAPTHVMHHELTYTALDAYLTDQLRLVREGRFDGQRGKMLRDQSGTWRFVIEVGKFFTPPDEPNIRALEEDLHFASA